MAESLERLEARAKELRKELSSVEKKISKLKYGSEDPAVGAWRRGQALQIVRDELS